LFDDGYGNAPGRAPGENPPTARSGFADHGDGTR
jgi:hypothetical protein